MRAKPPAQRPALPLHILLEVENLEVKASQLLSGCGGDLDFNIEKAKRILETFGVEIVVYQLSHYKSLSDYDERWYGDILYIAIESLIGLLRVMGDAHKETCRAHLLFAVNAFFSRQKRQAKERGPSIGETLIALRKKADLTQQAVADLTGIDLRNVQRHESGATKKLRKSSLDEYRRIYSERLPDAVFVLKKP